MTKNTFQIKNNFISKIFFISRKKDVVIPMDDYDQKRVLIWNLYERVSAIKMKKYLINVTSVDSKLCKHQLVSKIQISNRSRLLRAYKKKIELVIKQNAISNLVGLQLILFFYSHISRAHIKVGIYSYMLLYAIALCIYIF